MTEAPETAAERDRLKVVNEELRETIEPLIVIALDNLGGMNAETREECERDIAKARAAIAKASGGVSCANRGKTALSSVVDRDGYTIADCKNVSVGDWEANARFIAAAPDLLDAGRPFAALAVDRAADAPEWRDSDTVSVVVTVGQLRAIAAAIRKAEGGAS